MKMTPPNQNKPKSEESKRTQQGVSGIDAQETMGSVLSFLVPYQKGTAVAFGLSIVAAAHLLPSNTESSKSSLINLTHVGCFAVWFGTQFWVTFVAGLTKIKILPRIWFSKVQRALFDKYFLSGFVLNSIMLATFVAKHPFITWDGEVFYLGNSLLASSLCVGTNCFFIKPWVSTAGMIMNEYEEEKGYGDQPGPIKEGAILEDSNYKEIKQNFVKAHAASAILNMVTFALSGFHLWYLAKRVQF